MLLRIVSRRMRIRRAKREIAKLVSSDAPTVRIFSTPGATLTDMQGLYFLIVPNTETEADVLLKNYTVLYPQLRQSMTRVGYSADVVETLRFAVISKQAIDRDFGGNWIEVMSGQ